MTTLWRYTAIPADADSGAPSASRGELAGESAADVRASLRRIGLQVVDLRPVRSSRRPQALKGVVALIAHAVVDRIHQHLRTRRRAQRSELYDGLATMLEAGLPLIEAMDTVAGRSSRGRPGGSSSGSRLSARRSMFVALRERIRSGSSLDDAASDHPGWFDPIEIALLRAGAQSGALVPVLRKLSEEHQRAGELGRRLTGALTYPFIVALAGIAVVLFLSIKTLPDLLAILEQAKIEPPELTQWVMRFGQALFRGWWVVLLAALVCVVLYALRPVIMSRRMNAHGPLQQSSRHWTLQPLVLRRIAVAGFARRFAELLRAGIPAVEALRILEPTLPPALRATIQSARRKLEQGHTLAASLEDSRYFDPEFSRLLEIGQSAGELDRLLEEIGCRYERQARRLIDQLAALLEPIVLLLLAVFVGLVVMAGILPLLKLQEVIG